MVNGIDPMHHGIVEKPGHKVSGADGGAAVARPDQSTETNASTAKSLPGDTVVLTERAQLLERLEKTAAALPVIDRARVDAVKADIAAGKYEIDADNIADILLRAEREFGDS